MMYVVYNVGSTRIETGSNGKVLYATEAAAKAARTRMLKKAGRVMQLEVADTVTYYNTIEQMVARVNLVSGQEYNESVNTPNYCSPASEAYWSM